MSSDRHARAILPIREFTTEAETPIPAGTKGHRKLDRPHQTV